MTRFTWPESPPLGWLFLFGYLGMLWYSLYEASLPSISCSPETRKSCLYPLVKPGDRMALELWVFGPSADNSVPRFQWHPVESCMLNVTLPSSGVLPQEVTTAEENCTLSLPEVARIRWSDGDSLKGGPLRAKFRFGLIEAESEHMLGKVAVEVPFLLTRIVERKSLSSVFSSGNKARNLLEEPVPLQDRSEAASFDTHIPYLKYGSQPIVMRFVAETRPYGGGWPCFRQDGVELSNVPWNRTLYRPIIYVDESALQRSSQREIAPPAEGLKKPPVTLRIQISTVSPIRDAFNRQVMVGLSMAESMLGGSELDEFRYWLRDERLYRFFLTQAISFVHIWIDYLAFRDEVRFYRGKRNFSGISVSSVVTRLACSVIIFLYLLDGAGTSWVILLSVFSGVAVDGWKAWKLLRPTLSGRYPFVAFRVIPNPAEQTTARYDEIAITYLALVLYPLVIGWSIYALQHYVYTSWYSWLISNLANAVYTFGFIALCPQLYVNYRLKSVAHLPWKVFVYKVFNTFVDDVFAFLIDMPWKHRIMTLRDDVVFIMFLVQAYIYRVDKSRANEYGYAYEDSKVDDTKAADANAVDAAKVTDTATRR